MYELNNTYQPYETITYYTCNLTIPDDETTEVIIKTKTAGVCFATSPEDALNQTKTANEYSQQSYAYYILGYLRDNLLTIDANDVTLTYTKTPPSFLLRRKTYKISKGMWCLRMVSKWVEPEPRPKRNDEPPPSYNPNAPSFADMKQQIGKTPLIMRKKGFRINRSSVPTL